MKRIVSRKEFIKDTALISAMGVAPQFLTRTVEGAVQSINGFKDDRVLVVVQLGGGNDGLNMLVPHSNDAYYRLRPRLALKKERLLRVTDDLAFNDRLAPLKNVYDDGKLAVIQGVGYPNPNRSHFRSMEIWETGSNSNEYLSSGWIGRYFDHHCSGSARPQVGAALGKERPQAFEGNSGLGIAFDDPRHYGWQPGHDGATESNFAELNAPVGKANTSLDFLRHVTSNAIMSSHEVREAADRAKIDFRRRGRSGALNHTLTTVAGLIRADLATRIYYVSAGGFDTHANQAGQHDTLLGGIAEALEGFQSTLRANGTADRVMTMVFSEFGRRVAENNSGGTDHGTAAPMFLMGEHVRPGIFGSAPDLLDLDKGDLKHSIDFRRVYATVLEDWFKVNAQPILGAAFEPLAIVT